jgi:hypothetical protein
LAAPSKLTDAQWAQVRAWENEGRPRPETARLILDHYGVSITREALSNRLGPRKPAFGRAEGTRIFKTYLTDEQIEELRSLARGFGLRDGSPDGNISSLLRGIADGKYAVSVA